MIEYILDLKDIETEGELHVYLAEMLDFPSYYGRNFDALYDVLTDTDRETLLTLCNIPSAPFCHTFLRVVADAAAHSRHLQYRIADSRQP